MDDRSRNPDRTDPLHALSQSLARGASQILQSPLQHDLQRAVVGQEARDRGTGDPHGDLPGLTCEWCGASLHGFTIRREFCDHRCREAFYRAERRRLRKCLWCGGSMDTPYRGKIYFSKKCRICSGRDMTGLNHKRRCSHCGKTFRPNRWGAKFCSRDCYVEQRRTRCAKSCLVCGNSFIPNLPEQRACSQPCRGVMIRKLTDRPCPACGVMFRQRHASTLYCSRRCASRANYRAGNICPPGHVPRLTAKRFDAIWA